MTILREKYMIYHFDTVLGVITLYLELNVPIRYVEKSR